MELNEEMIARSIETLEQRVSRHGEEIDNLKLENVRLSLAVDNMNTQLEKLNDNLKWLARTVAGAGITAILGALAVILK